MLEYLRVIVIIIIIITEADAGWHGAMPPPNHHRFFKVRFLMSIQIFLDSIIDLRNETITFIIPCISLNS